MRGRHKLGGLFSGLQFVPHRAKAARVGDSASLAPIKFAHSELLTSLFKSNGYAVFRGTVLFYMMTPLLCENSFFLPYWRCPARRRLALLIPLHRMTRSHICG